MTFIDPRNVAFWLYDWLGADALTGHPAYADHSRETFDAILELAEKLAADRFAPHYKKSDRIEPTLENGVVRVLPEIREAIAAYAEAGLFAASFAPEHGGLGLPHVVDAAAMAHFMAANVSTAAFPMLTAGNARVLTKFGTKAQIETFALPEIEGRTMGTMCLSEPQAGSSLADVMTRAVPDGEDELGPRYRLTGNKMWISGGDHDVTPNIIHLVLAKIPDADGKLPAGTAGITLFIVPKLLPDGTRNDVTVAGLNHKMGYRGISNCLLNFGEREGAVGWRLGEAGHGLAIMFHMMNEARIFVGLGAAGLAARGYHHSLDYARDRLQGRPAAVKDPTQPQSPIIQHADVRRMLLAQKAFAEGALSLILFCAHLIDREKLAGDEIERTRLSNLLGLLTPIAKSWPSEFGLAANDHAIQIHGGYGYTRDFDVEQVYRDNRLNPIHEGTHGIQAMDLLGRKIIRDKGVSLAALGAEIAQTVADASAIPALAGQANRLNEVLDKVDSTVAILRAANADPLANASPFLSAFGHLVVGWLWLDQAVTIFNDADIDRAFREGKLRACRYFIEVELPKALPQFDLVASLNDAAA
ncbi:MAG TPA: acyl-CoA dehydrogenase, partial [Alphaproteobacteria bacterium]|nr:acyl-CoA dehydrogenase [Alphaproteobacteria bacterium]